MDIIDSAMASTACRACLAVDPDKMGRQRLAALASTNSVIRQASLCLPRKPAPGEVLPWATSLTPSSSRAAPRCDPVDAPLLWSSDPRWASGNPHIRALPDPLRLSASITRPGYWKPVLCVRLGAAVRLRIRTAVWPTLRRRVGAALVATDDPGQFFLVKSPQGLFGQCQLPLPFLHETPPLWGIEVIQRRIKGVTKTNYGSPNRTV